MKTQNKTSKITSVNVRIDDDLKERIAAVAAYRDITMSQLVREWFDTCIVEEEEIIRRVKEQLGEE